MYDTIVVWVIFSGSLTFVAFGAFGAAAFLGAVFFVAIYISLLLRISSINTRHTFCQEIISKNSRKAAKC